MARKDDDLGALFALCPQPMWVYDRASLRFLAVNDAAAAAYGYPVDTFLHLHLTDIFVAEDAGALIARIEGSLPERVEGEVWRHRRADGSLLLVDITARSLRFRDCDARLVIAREVTAERRAIETMESSERRFRELFEHSLGLICTHDSQGILLSLNPAAAESLGYSMSEVVGLPMTDFMPAWMAAHYADYLRRVLRDGSDRGTLHITHRDGTPRIWRYSNTLYHDSLGEAYVMGHAQDITERLAYEHQLRQQQAELEAVNDASPVGMFRTDLGGDCTYVNQTYERLSGLRADQALGRGWFAAVHPEDRAAAEKGWNEAVKARGKYASTHRFRHGDGRTVWVSTQAAPIVVDGEVAGFAGAAEDITQRQHAEQMLRRSERRLRTVADALPAMVAYVDSQQRYVFANAAYERNYGQERGKLVGRSVREVLGAQTYARRRGPIERVLMGERVEFEDEIVSDEDYRCVQITYIPQREEEDGEILGFHVMASDFTRKKLEERRLIQAAEVDSLTGLANRAGFLTRLERALARSQDQRSLLGLMYLDIDLFKSVNDSHGHAAGDALLRAFAERLSAALRSSDVIGRLGGDEFTVITEGLGRPEYASAAAAKIVMVMRRPFQLGDGLRVQVSTSVGLALTHGEGPIGAAEFLARADTALYRAKQAGRNGYRVA